MDVAFNIKVTVTISDIEGHGVEAEIQKVKEELECLSLGAAGVIHAQEYSIDSVEIARKVTFEEVQKKYEGCAILCVCGEILFTKEQTFDHWQKGHFEGHS